MKQQNTNSVAVMAIAVTLIAVFFVSGCSRQTNHVKKTSIRSADPSDQLLPSCIIKDGQRVIQIDARQFQFDPDRIVVKKGEIVKLEITSQDVTHGIKIEGYNINRTLKPSQTEIITFIADKQGQFRFQCSVFLRPGPFKNERPIDSFA